MGEDSYPLADASTSMTNRRILITMAVLVAVGTVAGFALSGGRFALGVLLGGLVGVVNYLWLDRATKALFRTDAIYSTAILAMKYVFRYVVIGAVLLAVFLTHALPIESVILGVATFAFAVVLQGLRSTLTRSS
jgi:hypothetical protein